MRKPPGKPGGFLLDMNTIEDTIRRADPDRYHAALFAPGGKRAHLFTLTAFNHELARIAETVREPMMGAIRLQWWRETVESAHEGKPREHDVARALADLFAQTKLPVGLFIAMIDAREDDAAAIEFEDLAALEAWCDATNGNLVRLASRVLGESGHDDLARQAGIAHALSGILRAIPFHAARGKVYLPNDFLEAAGTSRADIIATHSGKKLGPVIARITEAARMHLASARTLPKPGKSLPAFLPAAATPLYLKRVMRPGFDAFHDSTDIPLFRRQVAMLRAAWRGGL
jgi:phytoene synthase